MPFWASGAKWRKNFDRTYLSHSPPKPSPLSVNCLLIWLSVKLVQLPLKNAWTLPHEFKQVTLSPCLFYDTNDVSFILSCLFHKNASALQKLILIQSFRLSLQTNLIELAVLQQMDKYSIITILLVLFLMSN